MWQCGSRLPQLQKNVVPMHHICKKKKYELASKHNYHVESFYISYIYLIIFKATLYRALLALLEDTVLCLIEIKSAISCCKAFYFYVVVISCPATQTYTVHILNGGWNNTCVYLLFIWLKMKTDTCTLNSDEKLHNIVNCLKPIWQHCYKNHMINPETKKN